METTGFTENQLTVREAVGAVCAQFPNTYWQEKDQREEDPAEFHAALARDGWLGIALPEELGGSGLGISEATMMMQTITESGAGMAGAQAIHANVYATQPLARFGTREQLESVIPHIVSGKWRTCFGVTEPNSGLDTLRLGTAARRQDDGSYRVTGQKIWITCAQVARKMMLLARTTPLGEVKKPSEGLSMFCIDLDREQPGLDIKKIKKMGGRAVDANEVYFDNYAIPPESLIGEEGKGFKMILHGMNAERCLLAGEALGLGYAALTRAAEYAKDRTVFQRPIGMNQGISHPLADAFMKLGMCASSLFGCEMWRRRTFLTRSTGTSHYLDLNFADFNVEQRAPSWRRTTRRGYSMPAGTTLQYGQTRLELPATVPNTWLLRRPSRLVREPS